MQTRSTQKHIFYGTLLVLLFLGGLSSVFRADYEAKIVTVVSVGILSLLSLWLYVGKHKSLP